MSSGSPALIRILFPAPLNLGPGKIRLLAAIRDHGSISGAARQLRISYRRAWLMVDALNRACPGTVVDALNRACPGTVVDTATGGSRGGGTRLTPLGTEVLARYEAMLAAAQAAVAADALALATLLAPPVEAENRA